MLQQYPINSMQIIKSREIGAVGRIVERLRVALVNLDGLSDAGRLVQARDRSWAPFIFQDLFNKER